MLPAMTTSGTLGDRAALLRGALSGAATWRDAGQRERARRAVEAVAGPGPVPDRLAVAHLAHEGLRSALLERPGVASGPRSTGAEHLHRAARSGRGAIVSYCHLAAFPGLGASLGHLLADVHVVGGRWLAEPGPNPTERARRWRAMYDRLGVPVIDAEAGPARRIAALLREGRVVSLTFDWPGATPTRFLGRPTAMASGTARLAAETGALVVPTVRRWRGLLPDTVFHAPIDPGDHAGWQPLHAALAAWHGDQIARRRAALEDPRRPGAWGERATGAAWT
jgi:hypothetical protein